MSPSPIQFNRNGGLKSNDKNILQKELYGRLKELYEHFSKLIA